MKLRIGDKFKIIGIPLDHNAPFVHNQFKIGQIFTIINKDYLKSNTDYIYFNNENIGRISELVIEYVIRNPDCFKIIPLLKQKLDLLLEK